MARELSTPLNADDILWLKARYPEGYVDRMVELHGVKGKKAEKALQEPETPPEPPSGGADGGSDPGAPNGSENAGEDLIGVENTGDVNAKDVTTPATANPKPFDPATRNVEEVLAHLKDASDDEKSRVLAAEAEGKARSTVLNA